MKPYLPVLIWLCTSLSPGFAAEIRDPTTPPVGFGTDVGKMYPTRSETGRGGLQGIIGSNAAAIAIINGQMIKVGSYYGDAKLLTAGKGRAVLQTPTGRQVLYLHGPEQWVTHVTRSKQHKGLAASVPPYEGIVTASLLHVRAAAALNAALTGNVKRGDRLRILERHGEWLRIRMARLNGFVHGRYVDVSGAGDHAQRVDENKPRTAATPAGMTAKKGNP